MATMLHTLKTFIKVGVTASMLLPLAANAATRSVTARYNPEAGQIVLQAKGKEPLTVTSSAMGKELLLGFGQGIEVSGLVKAIQDSKGRLLSASNGYDTILFRTMYENNFDVASKGNNVMITLNTPSGGEKGAREVDSRVQLRLEILEARLKRETGEVHKAREMLLALKEQNPDDYRIYSELATTEEYLENWRGADLYYTKAHELAPLNEDIMLAQKNLWDFHRSRIKLDHDWEMRGSDTDFHVTTLSGYGYVQPYTRVGFKAESNVYQTGVVRRADGRIKSNSGTRHREELYVRHDYLDGDLVKAALYTGYNSLGFGGEYKLLDRYGDTTFIVDYQKVNWEYVEGVVDGAVRDRIALQRRFPLTPLWDARIGGGYNRYSIDHEDDVAKTISLNGEIRYQVQQSNPLITVGYVIDAEYRNDEKTAIDGSGVTYMLLPISSREIHFVDVSLYQELNEDWVAQAFLGYGYDRLGDSGPGVGGSLTYGLHEDFEAQIRASYSLGKDGSGDSLSRLGGYVMWKF